MEDLKKEINSQLRVILLLKTDDHSYVYLFLYNNHFLILYSQWLLSDDVRPTSAIHYKIGNFSHFC